MARLTWDALGERKYHIGVDRGVFYTLVGDAYTNGIAWNGLTGVDDDNMGRSASPLYSGDRKVGSEYSGDEFSGKIRCFLYPDEFEPFLGEKEIAPGILARQQDRGIFGFCYRSMIGNDIEGNDYGYNLHLIYNMQVTDFSRSYATANESLELKETEISFDSFSQELNDAEFDPLNEIVLSSIALDAETLSTLENVLYGTEEEVPRLPLPNEIIELTTPKQVMPEEWKLFPNTLLYPANELYPYVKGG